MKQSYEFEKIKKMASRNQQRCLNSQPFGRKRAYLNKQNCQQKLMAIEEPDKSLTYTSQIFDEKREKFHTQQIIKLCKNPNQFDSNKIFKQLHKVKQLIGVIQQQKNISLNNKPEPKSKLKTSYSTRTDSVPSPKSNDTYYLKNMIRRDKVFESDRSRSEVKKQQSLKNSRGEEKKMLKIRSNKTIIKVYNPFPTPMAEFI